MMHSPDKDALIDQCLKVTLEVAIWILDTSDNNLEIKKKLAKYVEESCWQCSYKHFAFTYFPIYAFASRILLYL